MQNAPPKPFSANHNVFVKKGESVKWQSSSLVLYLRMLLLIDKDEHSMVIQASDEYINIIGRGHCARHVVSSPLYISVNSLYEVNE